jgi:hypothetical protein
MNGDHPSSPDLKVLSDFLNTFDQAALAHARTDLTEDEKRDIGSLARGELSKEHRESLVPLLAGNQNAIELLADLMKGGSEAT